MLTRRKPLKRTPLKKKWYKLKRTPLKRGSYRLKRNPHIRTQAQADYHNQFPRDEIDGTPAMPTPHHIDHNHKNDNPINFFSLSWDNHIGNAGVHTIGDIVFCERNGLINHPKWRERYGRLKAKQR